jgi:hypothetical protein
VKSTTARTAALISGALAATALVVAPVHASGTAAPRQMQEKDNPGMQRMHELHMQGNPGMQRMHEMRMQNDRSMQRMHPMHRGNGHCSGHTTAHQ